MSESDDKKKDTYCKGYAFVVCESKEVSRAMQQQLDGHHYEYNVLQADIVCAYKLKIILLNYFL